MTKHQPVLHPIRPLVALLAAFVLTNSVFASPQDMGEHVAAQRAAIQEIYNPRAPDFQSSSTGSTQSQADTSTDRGATEVAPPEGASHHIGGPAQYVEGTGPTQTKLAVPKPAAPSGSYVSNSSAAAAAASAWPNIAFSSGSFRPGKGVAPVLQNRVSGLVQTGKAETYGFVLLNQHINPEIEKTLGGLGVSIIGPHTNAYKARFPLDPSALKAIADLPFVEWLGYSLPEQKISNELSDYLSKESAQSIAEVAVIINLFTDDADHVFADRLTDLGVVLGRYDAELKSYHAVVPASLINTLVAQDFVLFVELVTGSSPSHNESTPMIGMDYIRPGGTGTRYDGSSIAFGILDTGFMVGAGAATMHQDLNKYGCGSNFTSDAAGVWNDQDGHGTHVLATVSGTGTADARYKGNAPGIGNSASNQLRGAKVWGVSGTNLTSWTLDAMDFMDNTSECSGTSLRPKVINMSGGAPKTNGVGTDSTSRKLDEKTWTYRQLYVMSAGNDGPGAGTIGAPALAKNALTVGNVLDHGASTTGDIWSSSSRGPTGDGRMKPNIVAPGRWINSAKAGTTNQYDEKSGTSMAAPHVSGVVASLMEHYSEFKDKPHLVRAQLMASAILHDDDTTPDENTYGLGRVAAYAAHWARDNANGWKIHRAWGTVRTSGYVSRDIDVPAGTDRLVVVMTWDEPAASAGAAEAVTYDIDLWVDRGADCSGTNGRCGEYSSTSSDDNVEYIIINSPPAGTYRLKACPYSGYASGLPTAIAATVIRGDPSPNMSVNAVANDSTPVIGDTITVTASVSNPSYIASAPHLSLATPPSGLQLVGLHSVRKDGTSMDFGTSRELVLGDIREGDSRSAIWTFRATSSGVKTLQFTARSENGGIKYSNLDITVRSAAVPPQATLISPSGSIADTTPDYRWYAVSNSSWYYLWVNDSTGAKVQRWYSAADAGCSSGTGICSITPNTSLAQGAGTWWIKTYNSAGQGPWSNAMSFSVEPPGKATLLSPNGTIGDTVPSYTWNAVGSASWYYLWVDDSTGNKVKQWYSAAQAGCSSGTGICSVTPTTSVTGGSRWWVRTWNGAGWGPWSDRMDFTVTGGGIPPVATLISPSGTISDPTPTYWWYAVNGSTWYYLWVNDSSGQRIGKWYSASTAGCSSGTGFCSITPATALAPGAGRWWLRTWNSAGYGPWSAGKSFTVR